MRFYHSTGRSFVAVGAIVAGLAACGGESPAPKQDTTDWGGDPDFAQADAPLGEAVTGCSIGTSGYASNTLDIASFAGTVVISAPAGVLKMNGQTCVNGSGVALSVKTGATTNVVKRITMTGSAGDDTVLVDLYQGVLETVFAGGTGTGLDIGFVSGTTDSFLLRGTGTGLTDKINVVTSTTGGGSFIDYSSSAAPDGKYDIKISAADQAKFTLGNGADVFTAVTTAAGSFNGANFTDGVAFSLKTVIYGGDGADSILDGDGADTVYGGAGNDTIKGGLGNDILFGGADTDTLDYSARTVAVTVNLSGTPVSGGTGVVTDVDSPTQFESVIGGYGNDMITTIDSATLLYGGNGADTIVGAGGNDTIYGGNGADSITGELGTDLIYGGDGDDVVYTSITATDGNDTVYGGNGTDTVSYVGRTAAVNAAINAATGQEDSLGNDIEVLLGGSGSDSLTGAAYAETIYGGLGNDTISGGLLGDFLVGDDGDDIMSGDEGDDTLFGEVGADSLVGGAGADILSGGAANDTLEGGAGADQLFGGAGVDSLLGGEDIDQLTGGAGNDVMNGGGNPGDTCIEEGTDTTTNCEAIL